MSSVSVKLLGKEGLGPIRGGFPISNNFYFMLGISILGKIITFVMFHARKFVFVCKVFVFLFICSVKYYFLNLFDIFLSKCNKT